MFYKVNKVKPLDDMTVFVEFVEGSEKIYDVKPLMSKWKIFEDLLNRDLFNRVRVDVGGYGIIWNENIDLSCNELWENGKQFF